ncbi:MAG: hypothetical protein ACYCSA_00435 [Thermoplasmataceae archaeon]
MSTVVLSADFLDMRANEAAVLSTEQSNLRTPNRQAKGLESLVIASIVIATAGVPIYSFFELANASVIPQNFGGMSTQGATISFASSPAMGDIIGYEFWHWGTYPPVALFYTTIISSASSLGIAIGGPMASAAADELAASGAVAIGSIEDILLIYFATLGPVGWAVIATIAGAIVAM